MAASTDAEGMRGVLAPVLDAMGLRCYDVEFTGSGRARVVRVSVEDPNGNLDVEKLSLASRAVERVTDELIDGHYELEVSSPGVERELRRPEHFERAVGESITVKHDATGTTVRERGVLVAADHDTITVRLDTGDERTIGYDALRAARTIFEWGPTPRPGRGPRTGAKPVKEATRS
jgi:ribosome maturation factor RimP